MASSSGAGDISAYIADLEDRIDNDTSEPEYVRDYRKAQLFLAQGFFIDALACLESAMIGVRPYRNDFTWEGMFLSIGSLLASNLDYFGRYDEAEALYSELLDANPRGDFIVDYAIFLHKRKKDFDLAQKFFDKALELYPNHSSLHLRYAGFLRHAKRDLIGADAHYELAISTNPQNADALGSYASFLHGVIGNMEGASKHYEMAMKLDLTHANNLCNYGLFLSEVKNEYGAAEKYYSYALKAAPTHVNTLYNYGVMLDTHCQRKTEAESLYRRALDKEPKHPFALYNLAVLLEERLAAMPKSKKIKKKILKKVVTVVPFAAPTEGGSGSGEDLGPVEGALGGPLGGVDDDSLFSLSGDSRAVPLARMPSVTFADTTLDPIDDDEEDDDDDDDNTNNTNETKGIKEGDEKRRASADLTSALQISEKAEGTDESERSGREELLSEVRGLYERAMDADPTDAGTTADFGRFLWTKTGDTTKAEEVLSKAVAMDGNCEVALFNLGALQHRNKGDLHQAENTLYQLIKVNPSHSGGLSQLARVLIDGAKVRLDGVSPEVNAVRPSLQGAMDCYEKAIALVKDPSNLTVEYLQTIANMGDAKEKLRALTTVGVIMKVRGPKMEKGSQVKSMLESFQLNI